MTFMFFLRGHTHRSIRLDKLRKGCFQRIKPLQIFSDVDLKFLQCPQDVYIRCLSKKQRLLKMLLAAKNNSNRSSKRDITQRETYPT